MKIIYILVAILATLILLGWIGLNVQPKSFVLPMLQKSDPKTVPLPGGLPAPVERFYRTVYGDQIPVIETAVFVGRGRIRPFGVWLPARFVFVHEAGKNYRHYIEATFFGVPFLKVNEGYLNGESFFESPMGTYYNDANTNQGASLALWAEAGWFPSVWLTDSRVRWEAVDENTALLFVPFEDQVENFVVRFNPQTGLIDTMEAMRYREAGEGKSKILWITRNEPGDTLPGMKISATGSATWQDQGSPWAFFTIDEALYNADVSGYIRSRGR
jgi:hypothetical protein